MIPRAPLFRAEAVAFQQHQRQWGEVASLQPMSTKVVAWFLVASAAALVLFLFVAQYARKETAVGYLTPTTGTAKIFAPQHGTIKEVRVHEGDVVRAGQPLLTIETDQIAANGIDVNANMLETLVAQKELLAKNIKAEEQRAGSERAVHRAGVDLSAEEWQRGDGALGVHENRSQLL
jgi:membrane fusion protein